MPELNEVELPPDPLDELLTAYLDGELSPADARALEERLSREERVRQRLRDLSGAWDLLDNLPRETVDENFTKTTVAMVAVAARDEVRELEAAAPRLRRQRWLWTAAAGIASLLLGFIGLRAFWPDPNATLLADLSLLQQWRQYQQVGDLQFLRLLDQQGHFSEIADQDQSAAPSPDPLTLTAESDKRAYLAGLSVAQKNQLQQKQQEFLALDPAEQQRLRDFERQLRADPQAQRLSEVLANYQAWLMNRPPLEVGELAKLATPARLERIAKLVKDEDEQFVKRYGQEEIEPRDYRTIFEWFEDIVWRARKPLLETMKPDVLRFVASRMQPEANLDEKTPDQLQQIIESNEPHARKALMFHFWRHLAGTNPKILAITAADIQQLKKRLSKTALQRIEQFQQRNGTTNLPPETLVDEHLKLLQSWVWTSMQVGMSMRRHVSEEDLERFYKSLPEDQRNELQLLPAEEFKRELRRKFDERNGWHRGRPGDGPFGPKGFGGKGNRGPREDGPPPPGEGPPFDGPPPPRRPEDGPPFERGPGGPGRPRFEEPPPNYGPPESRGKPQPPAVD
ncbi:MAG: hypothetical protein SFX18_17715 [Pirellulales bacterium]|nr:hypothetical protein [Pirellulales bacterium]